MKKYTAILFCTFWSINAHSENLNFIDNVYQNNNNYVEYTPTEKTIDNLDSNEDSSFIIEEYDPIKPLNKIVFVFNKKTDTYLLTPIASSYKKITPPFIQSGVRNFLSYLYSPVNIVNYTLQWNPVKLANATGSFVANSFTLGLVDVGSKLKINKKDTNFGDTLSVWGVHKGPYLVLPLLGSSSLRDASGIPIDFSLTATRQFPNAEQNTLYGINIVQTRSDLLDASDIINEASLDSYEFEKSIWYQRRNTQEKTVKLRE